MFWTFFVSAFFLGRGNGYSKKEKSIKKSVISLKINDRVPRCH